MGDKDIVNISYGSLEYVKTNDIVADVKSIIVEAQTKAHQAVNVALVIRNWLLGRRIAEEELQGEDRVEYGAKVIKRLLKS